MRKHNFANILSVFTVILASGCGFSLELKNKKGADLVPIIFPARFLFGQPDFGQSSVAVSETRLNQVEAVYYDGTRIYVCDRDNRRLLIWNSYQTFLGSDPTESINNPPDIVLFQNDFNSNTSAIAQNSITSCRGVFAIKNKLFVSDATAHRVLVWNTIPTVSNTPPDLVLGQALFTTGSSGLSATKMNQPMGIGSDGTRLFVADRANHRVLVWNSFPTSNGQAADYALGQPDLNTNTASAAGLSNPRVVRTYKGKIYVSDSGNNRVVVWDTIPTTFNSSPSWVVGQPDFSSSAANSPSRSEKTFATPFGVWVDSEGLYVGDYGNSRVLRFQIPITSNQPSAINVYGQPDFTGRVVGSAENETNGPIDMFKIGGHVIMSDQDNNRLISDLFMSN